MSLIIKLMLLFRVFWLEPEDIYHVAKVVYCEASVEDLYGKILVAKTVQSRVLSSGRSYFNVTHTPSQFSTSCRINERSRAWDESVRVAFLVVAQSHYVEHIPQPTHFHTRVSRPHWGRSCNRTLTHGAHTFCLQ